VQAADVGFAVGDGTAVALESADAVLMKSNPDDIELSRATLRKMRQNLLWALAYSVIAFPAAGVFHSPVTSPQLAARSPCRAVWCSSR
jgi:Cu2+-exporting ATPase